MTTGEHNIQRVVDRLGRRLQYQAALSWALRGTLAACLIMGFITLGYRLWWFTELTVEYAAWAGGTLIVLATALGILKRENRIALASRIDQANSLHDRLATAIELLQRDENHSDIEQAQIRDAVKHLTQANVAIAAPWTWPREIGWVIAAIALLFGINQIRVSAPSPLPPHQLTVALSPKLTTTTAEATPALTPKRGTTAEEVIEEDAESQLAANDAERDALTEGDKAALDVLNQLNLALSELAKSPETVDPREITNTANAVDEAIEQLAGNSARQAQEEMFEEKLAQLAKAMEKTAPKALRNPTLERHVQELAKVLERRDYEAAAEKLEALMELFSKLPKREQERLAKMFESLGERFKSQLQKDLDKLRNKRDRLRKKEQEQGRLSKRDRSRLNRTEKQLDRLERQQEERQEPHQKQLDRLSKDMQDLANKMRRQQQKQERGQKKQNDGPQQKKNRLNKRSAKELAEMLRRMGKRRKQRRAGQKLKMKMADMKELLQRRRRSMKSGRKRLQELAKGRKAKRDIQNKQQSMNQKNNPGEDSGLLLRRRQEGRQSWTRRNNDDDTGAGRTRGQMLSGKQTDLEAKTLEDFVDGKEGKGTSTREILYGAAKQGTRVRGYGKVHIDYSMRASRQMEDEKIPAGYREYVERYFRLIRTR